MIKVEHTVVINRPVEEVAGFVRDPANNNQWQSGCVESSQTSEGPLGVGTTGRDVRQFLGRRMESTWEITEYEDNKKSSFKTTSGPIPMQGSYTFEPSGGGTKVTFTVQGDPGGFFRLAEPILARMVKRQIEADYNNLKDLLESRT